MNTLQQYGRALNASELAQLLGVTKKSIYRMADRGELPSFKVGNCLRFCGPTIAQTLS